MPCDSIQTSEAVPIGKIDLPRMERALKEAGWTTLLSDGELSARRYDRGATERVTLRKGESEATIATNRPTRNATEIATEIRRAYAVRTVQDLAPKYGWKYGKMDGNKLTLTR